MPSEAQNSGGDAPGSGVIVRVVSVSRSVTAIDRKSAIRVVRCARVSIMAHAGRARGVRGRGTWRQAGPGRWGCAQSAEWRDVSTADAPVARCGLSSVYSCKALVAGRGVVCRVCGVSVRPPPPVHACVAINPQKKESHQFRVRRHRAERCANQGPPRGQRDDATLTHNQSHVLSKIRTGFRRFLASSSCFGLGWHTPQCCSLLRRSSCIEPEHRKKLSYPGH